MAKVLVFRYACGWEVSYPMPRDQKKATVVTWVGHQVSRRHTKECEPCRVKRQERFQARRAAPAHVESQLP